MKTNYRTSEQKFEDENKQSYWHGRVFLNLVSDSEF